MIGKPGQNRARIVTHATVHNRATTSSPTIICSAKCTVLSATRGCRLLTVWVFGLPMAFITWIWLSDRSSPFPDALLDCRYSSTILTFFLRYLQILISAVSGNRGHWFDADSVCSFCEADFACTCDKSSSKLDSPPLCEEMPCWS